MFRHDLCARRATEFSTHDVALVGRVDSMRILSIVPVHLPLGAALDSWNLESCSSGAKLNTDIESREQCLTNFDNTFWTTISVLFTLSKRRDAVLLRYLGRKPLCSSDPLAQEILLLKRSSCSSDPLAQVILLLKRSSCSSDPLAQEILLLKRSSCSNDPLAQAILLLKRSSCSNDPLAQAILLLKRSSCSSDPLAQEILLLKQSSCSSDPFAQAILLLTRSWCSP
ncbi:hypothetical protein J6590_096057 [Homalodisca vitripennis]|nr:hypothetical protein J6590_096057 [Homalodisca vitripennis]